MQVLKKILLYKYIYYVIFLIVILLSYIRINTIYKSNYNEKDNNFVLKVLDIKDKDNQDIVTFSGKEKLISYISNFPYNVGDIVKVKGELVKLKNNTIFNLFNYRKYLQSRGIYWELKTNDIKLVKENSSLFYKIKYLVTKRIKEIPHNEYLYAFILGDSSYINSDIKDKYQNIGLSYLLSIGSLQIMMITTILDKLKMSDKGKLILKIVVIVIYIIFTNLVIGVLRSGLCYILKSVLKHKKIKYRYSNLILIVGIILLIINPYYISELGFLYSFSISLAISILHYQIKGSFYKRLFQISIIAFIVSLPINIYSNYEINFLAIIFSIIMVPIFHYIVFPLCIIVFIFPMFSFLFETLVIIIEEIINMFSSISFFNIVFRKPSMVFIIVYYLLIVIYFYQKKYFFLLIIALFIHHNINNIVKEKVVTFLDVKEGDAIVLKNNSHLSLIDTGGSINYEYSKDISKYLKSLGINKINELIITHGDYDHMGSSINLVNIFEVEKVIFNCGENSDLERELIKVLDKKHIKYYSCIKELNIDNNKLYFLQTKEYDNENDNSNVIYTELDGYKFMFMGDASITTEKEILSKYNLPNIDVLKVGHHGSKTSSSEEFINDINPKYSIISVGKNNRYGHPNKEVLENLNNSKIYRTDKDGSIMFKIKNNKLKIKTCTP